ncbi:MAG: hypothetical protein K0S71_295 [Clostridia bacterium]|jgi:hypothetical protein|nr:hypothetical protein [Clostridia bacterium]
MFNVCLENISKYDFKWFTIGSTEDLDSAIEEIQKNADDEILVVDYEEIKFSYIYQIREAIEKIEELDEYESELVLQIAKQGGYSLEEAIEMVSNDMIYMVHGTNLDKEDAVSIYLDETCFFDTIPDDIVRYFDYSRYLNDMECDGVNFIELADKVIINFPR